ncbi:adenylate/guanylate cyclase domain-containing protein [Plebeiibacterium marinum]|uniref:Adenylate/guanylate cyclase domain-containing protein n=1 Tax=Plebeiibacterium marinum TaxID=2992111 RepID=A0AAE3MC21_9BACT|nr:adenylate/guanylate cyclase domain-containing protein [Plebeiobacterium marinum]MCW3804958.1 adenylate/guanylate cyclase domain-containing protein [Plebeiobacterium marinum]
MFLKEKIKIWFSKIFGSFRYHLLFWNFALFFYVFLTGNQSIFVNYFNLLSVDSIYSNTIFLAVSVTVLFTVLDMLFSDRMMRFSPIRSMIFLKSLLYFILAFVILFLAANKTVDIAVFGDYKAVLAKMPELQLEHLRFLAYFYLACIANNSFKEMRKKIGVTNFFSWFFGMLNKPYEEKKIFMFIDMKSSTTIAERLGHEKFSRLVQDVFNDMSMIYNYHGEVYQYLGDGAIISWNVRQGVKNLNCIKAFYSFLRVVERRGRYYKRRYGDVPKFKAGLHVGKVMVLQVGTIRRDISYNGDTINTAARIESMCNEYKQDLLISGVLYESFEDRKEFAFKEVGTIKLKGKKQGVLIYQVRQKLNKRR